MENINLFIVFLEGIISFVSPCILPILPIYLSILSNSSVENLQAKKVNKSLILNTIFFTLGISSTFFILGSSIGALGDLLIEYKHIISIVGGIAIVILGLFYIGILNLNLLQREKRFKMNTNNMNPLSAYILGFTFSFGWTPCIGPMLTSVLIMASTAENAMAGNILIGVYTLGFILPFIIVALFYNKLFKTLDAIKMHMDTIKKVGGIVLILTGLFMTYTGVKDYQRYESSNTGNKTESSQGQEGEEEKIKALDFELTDQYGNTHSIEEYKGKTIFLNMWATWCPPCKEEMPYIEDLYKEYGENKEDVIILGLASPNLGKEKSQEYIEEFLSDNNYTFPTVFDHEATQLFSYGINSFPSTLIIDEEGYITQYVPGAMNKDTMKYLIESAR